MCSNTNLLIQLGPRWAHRLLTNVHPVSLFLCLYCTTFTWNSLSLSVYMCACVFFVMYICMQVVGQDMVLCEGLDSYQCVAINPVEPRLVAVSNTRRGSALYDTRNRKRYIHTMHMTYHVTRPRVCSKTLCCSGPLRKRVVDQVCAFLTWPNAISQVHVNDETAGQEQYFMHHFFSCYRCCHYSPSSFSPLLSFVCVCTRMWCVYSFTWTHAVSMDVCMYMREGSFAFLNSVT